ncbi:MAG: hypothetical protein CL910_11875 [Deltaproteobacteria bacterium]|nr:hypothetical protein [Deltaproteobacteria bacterium]
MAFARAGDTLLPVRAARLDLILFLSLLSLASPAAAQPAGAPSRGDRREMGRPPFDVYLGQKAKEVRSQSRVEGARSRHVFAPVLQGDVVRHDFLVKNDGHEPLELREVRACSGCILESHSRRIQPGLEGRISLLILTDSLGGEALAGTVTAKTSDPARPELAIDVALRVVEFAALSPYRVWLRGSVGEEIVERCVVTPNEDYPFSITDIKARKGVWFTHELRDTEVGGVPAYEITLRNTRRKPGPYQDVLFIQTDHPARPELKIRIEGRIGGEAPGGPAE